jgi:hypothetical protein
MNPCYSSESMGNPAMVYSTVNFVGMVEVK